MKQPIETLVPRIIPGSSSRLNLGHHGRRVNGLDPSNPPASNMRRSVRSDGICVLTFDRPNSSANIFDRRTLIELRDQIILIAADPSIKGLVLISAKPSIFVAGADLTSMNENTSQTEMREFIEL